MSQTEGGIWELMNDMSLLNVNSKTKETAAFTASPNPTSGIVEIAGESISQITVYDILGKEVFNNTYSALDKVSLNIAGFASAVYMVNITNNIGNTVTIKVIKK